MTRKMAKDGTGLQAVTLTTVIGLTTIWKEKAHTPGLMELSMFENGETISSTATACSIGRTVTVMQETILNTKNTGMECPATLTATDMKVNG